ncbi:MAG: hypothetical protein WBA46_07460, partial [Thermomicrobiales bacterium]
TVSMSAAAAPAAGGPARAEASLAYITTLLAQGDGDKKLPDPTETPTETTTSRSRGSSTANDALIGVLGGDRTDFEDEFGTPADDRDASDFATGAIYEDIRGFDSIQVYWSDSDVALHIVLNASRDWTEARALTQAEGFLPTDVELDQNPETLDGGELLYLGSSSALADVTDRATYRDLGVGGRPGDLRVILIPGSGDTFSTVDIAIGAGDEFTGAASGKTSRETPEPTTASRTSRETPEPTARSGKKASTADADTYLADVRDAVDTRQQELDRFYEIIALGADATDPDFTELTDIVAGWLEIPAIEAPAGFQEIEDAFTSMNNNFMGAALSFVTWISDTKANASSLDDMSQYLKDAQSDLTTVDGLLSDEGV